MNEDQLDAAGGIFAPLLERVCKELRAIVHANRQWQTPPLGQLRKLFHDPFAGDALGNGDVKRLPVEVVDDVERPEGFSDPERIAHEIHAPVQVGGQRLE